MPFVHRAFWNDGSKFIGAPVALCTKFNEKPAREFITEKCAVNTCSDVPHDDPVQCMTGHHQCADPIVSSESCDNIANNVNTSNNVKPLSFLHWNVQGIVSKLFDADFVSFVSTFDFVFLVETFVEDFCSSSFPNYSSVCVPAVKLSTRGRRSGGLICLIKNEFFPFLEQVSVKSNMFCAFIMKKEIFGALKDILLVTCYIPPEGSPYYAYFDCENGISMLEEYLTDCLMAYGDLYILLCGDLNARTANSSHFCQGDQEIFDFQYSSKPASVGRYSQDISMNGYGKLLMNFCTAMDLCLLNGMCYGDQNGCYTFVSDSGCSVNDYFLMSCELFSTLCDICELRVCE